MKKLVIFLFLAIFMVNSALAAEYGCTNDSIYSSKTRDIKVGDQGKVNGINIAVTYADEAAIVDRMAADILVDSEKLTVSNDTNSTEVELIDGVYHVSLVSGTADAATIKVGSSSEEIEEDEIATIAGLKVFLTSVTLSSSQVPTADILVGAEELSLSKPDSLEELLEVDEKKHLFKLVFASDSSASIMVGQCNTGDVILIAEDPVESEENSTKNNETETDSNETEIDLNETETPSNETTNETMEPPSEESEQNDTTSNETESSIGTNLKALDASCSNDSECESGNCKSDICQRKGFFSRIISWFKGLF